MKNSTRQILAAAVLACAGIGGATAYELQPGEAVFSYRANMAEDLGVFGVGDGDNHFDVAVRIDARQFAGMKIKGVIVPFGDTSFLENMSAWISNRITSNTEGTLQSPDIMSKTFTFSNPNSPELGWAEVMFDTPYTVEKNDVYVGYTFWVAELNKGNYNPIFVSNHDGEEGRGLFVQTGGWPWKDIAKNGYDWCSPMQIIVEAPEASVAVGNVETARVKFGETAKIKVPLYRAGSEKVESVDYELIIDNMTYSYHKDFAADETGTDHISHKAQVLEVVTPKLREEGNHKFYINVTKVNGKANPSPNFRTDGIIVVSDFIPVKVPVVEESTSTGCGYCTRGWYSLEVMGRLHRETKDMLAISYHNEDQKAQEPMTVMPKAPMPTKGNPSIRVDRVLDPETVDPNMKTPTFGVQECWEERAQLAPPAGIEVTSRWLDTDHNELEVTAKVRFIESFDDGRFLLDVGLLHDGMKGNGARWAQSNYYAGVKGAGSEPEWKWIGEEGSPINGLFFNDVFVAGASEEFKGIEGAIPQSVEERQEISYTHVFKIKELKNTTGEPVVQNPLYLRPFAILLNKSNVIENAGMTEVPGYNYEHPSSVEEITAAENAEALEYYDLTGSRVSKPGNGIYIVRLSDGSVVKRVIR